MTLVIDYSWEPEPSVLAGGFDLAADRMEQMRNAFTRTLHEVLIPDFEKNFDTQGGTEAWQPLSPYTLLRREDQGYGPGPMLVRTGELKRWALDPDVWIIQDDQMSATVPPVYGDDGGEYGSFTQTGTSRMPARPYWEFTEEGADGMVEIFSEEIGIIFDTSFVVADV